MSTLMKATLTFPNINMAKKFASQWAYKTCCGNDMSAVKEDGSVDVTVYDVDEAKKQFIEDFVNAVEGN